MESIPTKRRLNLLSLRNFSLPSLLTYLFTYRVGKLEEDMDLGKIENTYAALPSASAVAGGYSDTVEQLVASFDSVGNNTKKGN